MHASFRNAPPSTGSAAPPLGVTVSTWCNRFSVGLLGLLCVAGVLLAAWATPRGFDFIDGGYYYLTFKFPSDVADTHTSFHLVGSLVFNAVAQNIVAFRVVSWLLGIGAVVALARALYRQAFHAGIEARPQTLAVSGLCGFLLSSFALYTTVPAALTYNSLNCMLLLAGVGLLIAGSRRLAFEPEFESWFPIGLIAAACLVATVQVFIKPTTGLLFGASIGAFCLLSPLIRARAKVRFLALSAGGAFIGLGVVLLVVGNWNAIATRFSTFLSLSQNTSFKADLYSRLQADLLTIAAFVRTDLQWSLATLLIGAVATRVVPSRWRPLAAVLTVVLSVACWVAALVYAEIWRAAHVHYANAAVTRLWLEAALWATGVFFAVSPPRTASTPRTDWRRAVHFGLLWLLLMLLPFAGAFGTTNPLHLNSAFQAPLWLAAALLPLFNLPALLRATAVNALLLTVGVFAVAQLYDGQVRHPYSMKDDLQIQNTPVAIGYPATTLLLEPAVAKFIDDARGILTAHGFKPGDDIFAFFNLPGVVYAVGGRSPVVPWYFGRIYVDNPVEEYYMQAAGQARRDHAWIITQADAPRFKEHYARGGFNFPDNYDLLGTLTNPATAMEIKFWKRRATP